MDLQQITSRLYFDMEGVLPPQARHARDNGKGMVQGFLVGEPTDHNKEGEARYASFFSMNGLYYRGEAVTVAEFTDYINDYGIYKETSLDFDNAEMAEDCEEYLTLTQDYPEDAILAYIGLFGSNKEDFLEDFEESYAGQWDSDIDFAENMAEELGFEEPSSWPYNCIDWEHAARELMYDYAEDDGYYFRNI